MPTEPIEAEIGRIEAEFRAALQDADVLIMPTNLGPAFPIADGEPGTTTAVSATLLTAPLNLTGVASWPWATSITTA